ncbi:MAG: hypothetical protein IJN63_09700 [Clostridia bacterium]|nr:hypothetical protein [Clostridia bacterium]
MAVFTNRATLSYNNKTVNSNTVTGEVVDVITLTKAAVRDVYGANDIITYTVSIANAGTVDVTGLTVTDDLGAYPFGEGTLVPLTYIEDTAKYYVNGVLAAGLTVSSVSPLVLDGITVPAGGNALLIYAARANEFAPPCADGTITNTATATSCGAEASTVITAVCEPDLAVEKALCPGTVPCNGEISYTITIINNACCPATAEDNVVLADTFNPPITITSVTVDGAELPATSYTYNEETGEFATVAGAVTVPGATFTQDPETGVWTSEAGATVIVINGNV